MYRPRRKLFKYFLWVMLLASIVASGAMGILLLINIIAGIYLKPRLVLETGALVFLTAVAAGAALEVHRRQRLKVVLERAKRNATVLELGASHIGTEIINTPAEESFVKDKFLLQTYNAITVSAVAATMDNTLPCGQERLESGIGHAVRILALPSAWMSVREAYYRLNILKPQWFELLSRLAGERRFVFKSSQLALGVSSSVIPAVYEFWKIPQADVTLHTVTATRVNNETLQNDEVNTVVADKRNLLAWDLTQCLLNGHPVKLTDQNASPLGYRRSNSIRRTHMVIEALCANQQGNQQVTPDRKFQKWVRIRQLAICPGLYAATYPLKVCGPEDIYSVAEDVFNGDVNVMLSGFDSTIPWKERRRVWLLAAGNSSLADDLADMLSKVMIGCNLCGFHHEDSPVQAAYAYLLISLTEKEVRNSCYGFLFDNPDFQRAFQTISFNPADRGQAADPVHIPSMRLPGIESPL